MTREVDPLHRTILLAGAALLVALAVTFVFTSVFERPRLADRPLFLLLVRAKLLVTTFNILLLVILSSIYVSLYRELPNQFTLSLLVFSVALLLFAITSNPVLHHLLGFRGGPGLGPFTFIPDLFASVATVVLIYQSYR
jgi:hypothetical protein